MPPVGNASSGSGRSTPQLTKIVTNPIVHGPTHSQGTRAGGSQAPRPSSTTYAPAPSARDDKTTQAVNALLSAMQMTLGALGTTFDILGEQTISVATLGPAVTAVNRIERVRTDIQAQSQRQEALMQKTRDQVQTRVTTHIREVLRPQVDGLIAAAVGGLVEDRVRTALQAQIPQDTINKLADYRRRIDEVRIALVNAEARRHNALIPHDAELRPLLRPRSTPETEFEQLNGAAGENGGDAQASGQDIKHNQKNKNKRKSRTAAGANALNADGAEAQNGGGAGTPSELFPRTVGELRELDAKKAHRLVLEYGLSRDSDGSDREDEWEDLGEDGQDRKGGKGGKGQTGNSGAATGHSGGPASAGAGPKPGGQHAESNKEKKEREKEEQAKRDREREAKLREREVRRTADLNEFMRFVRMSLGGAVLFAWWAACASLGDGADAGVRMEFS
ncbi:hypothetical protein BV20DRAFT_50103 [Pilatotrama ljubarskyi]|nr:hypothetical protein BV20DRAFT_50103 [Pilatotrama ljubarskyi]